MCLGTVGQITEVTEMGADRKVQVRAGDRDITASLLAVDDELRPGDWVLVHSGLVLSRLTEEEALDALDLRDPTSEGAR
jgi:hydrogenase expression/formation protein HypC